MKIFRQYCKTLFWITALVVLAAGYAMQAGAARIDDARSGKATPRPPVASGPGKTAAAPVAADAHTSGLPETDASRSADDTAAKKSGAPVREAQEEKYVTLDFDNVNIEVFVKFISELTGKNFIIDEKVKGKVTIFSPKKIPLRDVYKVFLSVLEINGYATVPVGDMVKIVPSVQAREKSVETRFAREARDSDDRMVTQIVALERANPDEVKRVLDPIVSKTSSVLSYAPAGILIITDYLSNVRRLLGIVKALDVEGAGAQRQGVIGHRSTRQHRGGGPAAPVPALHLTGMLPAALACIAGRPVAAGAHRPGGRPRRGPPRAGRVVPVSEQRTVITRPRASQLGLDISLVRTVIGLSTHSCQASPDTTPGKGL